ncbi:MAG: STAS domain-containing protein [Bacteroidales bacterium]|nr:STAS domain-containing protein [Bacteroidales bacterium]
MENKLEIQKTISGKTARLELKGRLDANWAGHLDDYVNTLIREGIYEVKVILDNVDYLSSAGIRILVMQYKNLDKIGGSFYLSSVSDSVRNVLEMVGLADLLIHKTALVKEAPKHVPGIEGYGYRFINSELQNSDPMTVWVNGDPDKVKTASYQAADSQRINFDGQKFALGLGAIGKNFEDCKNRYGEFIGLGEAIAYLPTDNASIPDYAVMSGKFIPAIESLFSIQVEGAFSDAITFEPTESEQSIQLNHIVSQLAKITGHSKFAMLMIAESQGLIGMSLRKSPVNNKLMMEFPAIRDSIYYTTEPIHHRMLTVSFGYFDSDPDHELQKALRPIAAGARLQGHLHTAIFPYQPLRKDEISYENILLSLFGSSEVQDILHLLNDTREINGLGDSHFKNGTCWIGRIE